MAAVGDGSNTPTEDLGRITYERTANFGMHHEDVDTMGINQLQSTAGAVCLTAMKVDIDLPKDIQYTLDTASVPHHKLWGYKRDIVNVQGSAGPELAVNTTLSAGMKIITKSKFVLAADWQLIELPIINNELTYPLSGLSIPGYINPLLANYFVFSYVPMISSVIDDNIIDWSSPYTTLNRSLSTTADWYGDGGILETSFNYMLTQGIFSS